MAPRIEEGLKLIQIDGALLIDESKCEQQLTAADFDPDITTITSRTNPAR